MLAVELEKSAVKAFMGQLLRENVFDMFEVRTIDIATNVHINFDGQLVTETQEEETENAQKKPGFSTWEALRPLIFGIIKASPKPRHVKIVFSYRASEACDIHPNAAALFLNMSYENDSVTFTTGVAQREFLMDKSLDVNWDEWVKGFFARAELSVSDRE